MGNKLTTLEFVNRAGKLHDYKYDYDFVEYINTKTKVQIICDKHGVFEQTPNHHLKGSGCKLCNGGSLRNTEEFIKLSTKIHGTKYDYSMVNYSNARSEVQIVCIEHGIFEQQPKIHLRGHGCLECATQNFEGFYCKSRAAKNKEKYKNIRAYIYCVKLVNNSEMFYKIGISKNVEVRMKNIPYEIYVIDSYKVSLYKAILIETNIKRRFRKSRYKPKLYFEGYTECFDLKINLKSEINSEELFDDNNPQGSIITEKISNFNEINYGDEHINIDKISFDRLSEKVKAIIQKFDEFSYHINNDGTGMLIGRPYNYDNFNKMLWVDLPKNHQKYLAFLRTKIKEIQVFDEIIIPMLDFDNLTEIKKNLILKFNDFTYQYDYIDDSFIKVLKGVYFGSDNSMTTIIIILPDNHQDYLFFLKQNDKDFFLI